MVSYDFIFIQIKMFKFLKERLDFWLFILTVALIPIIAFLLGLNFRVDALERDQRDFKDFIKLHTEQQAMENSTLSSMKASLDLVTGYFKLTPKD